MKKVLLTLFAVVATAVAANAQIYLGGSLGITYDEKNTENVGFSISPEIGYNFNEKWAVGGIISYTYDYGENSLFEIAPYARFSFFRQGMVSLFLDGGVDIQFINPKVGDNETAFGVGIVPGVNFQVSENFSLVARYGFLGYTDKKFIGPDSGLSLSGNTLSLGLFYNF